MNSDSASLERLHDIIVPPAVSWWPPAPGWYWVLGFATVLFLFLVLEGLIRWQHNRYRREALAELARQEGDLRNSARCAAVLTALAELLKRTALTAFPRERVAQLTGPPWYEFLDRKRRTSGFARGNGAILERVAYDPRSAAALDETKVHELVLLVRDWIRHHQPDLPSETTEESKDPEDDSDSSPDNKSRN